ncbi:protein-glutamine gamma-glutamyltransferase [Pontibacillus marinus]|uniref:Protein-glutamine gamma-glutamyltransferase n=1 Tax=Pontibacillus marinus BH030004 = DSM 16465 TaxID=1385511 RepID=A0A0A5GC62_9BACI|nr:protein-glutamine gamma-glutamyltransferase [Pontibacillus marinus]KGX90776.1 protein-glutamine gamma-glutamyltransferase [Pontibacillus marinus BH030004 = DSM 16465]
MIQVAGTPFQLKDSSYFGSDQTLIVKAMIEAPSLYSFSSWNDFLFEINVRKDIIESAKVMNEGESEFTTFQYTQCNPEYWYLTTEGGFQLKPNQYPSNAIRDIYRNSSLYAFECAMACVMNFYKAILDRIGDEMFNYLFQNLYLYSWHTDVDLGLYTFYGDHYIPGDVVYFNNPEYDPSTPWYRGVNAVTLYDGNVFGHGFGIKNTEKMIETLNETRRPTSNQSAYLTSLVTRISLQNNISRSILNPVYKKQPMIIHHNKPSISYKRYLSYLQKMFKRSL